MRIKSGVKVLGVHPVMWGAATVADSVWKDYGQELVITCGTEGTHTEYSDHYKGYALDLRTRYFSDAEKPKVAQALREALTEDFYVVVESTHIHLGFRPRI